MSRICSKHLFGKLAVLLMLVLGLVVTRADLAMAQPAAQSAPQIQRQHQQALAGSLLARSYLPFFEPRYVALGDSVAVGLGLAPLPNASAEDTACGRSASAYAYEVGSRINSVLDAASFGMVHMKTLLAACQQAGVNNLTQPQDRAGLTVAPQLDAAFAAGTPALLTLTMGANDVHWAEFINQCVSAANCDTAENTAKAQAFVQTTKDSLTANLATIRARSHFLPPVVVVTGYYNALSAACVSSTLTSDEVAWLKTRTEEVNAGLHQAASHGGLLTRFAPVDFTGHDICSPDSWLQRPFSGDPAPLHPTLRGQQAMADAVLRSLGL